MLLAWDNNVQIRLLVKDSFFKGPLAPIMRATGAVELDRDNPGATIRDAARRRRDRRDLPARHRGRGHPQQGRVLEVRLLPDLPADRPADHAGLPRRAVAHRRLGSDLRPDRRRRRRHGPDPRVLRRQDRLQARAAPPSPRLREEEQPRRDECARRDSNSHWPRPKPGASASWATGARRQSLRPSYGRVVSRPDGSGHRLQRLSGQVRPAALSGALRPPC